MDYGENNVNAGPLKDFEEICVDHFLRDDLKSTTFFLSHAHTDHMAGLETAEFLERLNEPGIKLYCHHITPMLLEHWNSYLGGKSMIRELIKNEKLIPLDTDMPVELNIPASPRSYKVTVTLLAAGHCPGSVMFLFETDAKRILHTGDCRLSVDDLKVMKPLHTHDDERRRKKKRIDQLYIDTTFCAKNASEFPNRKVAFDEAIDHIRQWITQGDHKYVLLKFAGRFAHEYIIVELYKAFGRKVHVEFERYAIYNNIPGLNHSVTRSPATPFHLCNMRDDCLVDKDILTARFTSMWFTKKDEEDRKPIVLRGRTLSVCYAMHSSLDEIAKMIDYLQPTVVTPFVRPKNSSMKEVHDALRDSCSWKFDYKDYSDKCLEVIPASIKILSEVPAPLLNQRLPSESDDEPCCSPKKPRTVMVDNSKWNFQFSPSSSQGSGGSSSRDNSQELMFETAKNQARNVDSSSDPMDTTTDQCA